VADVGEEEAFGDGDVGGVLVGGGVGEAHVGVPFPTYVGIAALLLVVLLLFLPPSLLVITPVTVTRNRKFFYKVIGLTTLVAYFLGAGFVILPLLCLRIWRKLLMMSAISSLSSLEASMGAYLM
jgi:predicted lysophospholipase L1 biosynthesis ABC-type transport system permease subunit